MSVGEIHDNVLRYLNEHFPYFATHFLAMGRPVEVNDTHWAYVMWSDGEVTFCLNADNVGPMDIQDQVFLCMHETLHVFLKHDILDFPNQDLKNIATDIVINDYLVDNGLETTVPLYFGPDHLGFSCSELPVSAVYRMLEDMGMAVDPQVACGFAEHGGDAADIPVDMLPEAPADFAGTSISGQGYSPNGPGVKDWVEETGTSLRWAELLRNVRPDMFATADTSKRVASFSRLHRKVAWNAPRTLLPVARPSRLDGEEEDGRVPGVVIAVDVSDSIPTLTRNDFVTLANSVPEGLIKGYYCTFNSSYQRFYQGDRRMTVGGGTNFGAIVDFIDRVVISDLGHYPDAVVVLTDGDANFRSSKPPTDDQFEKWIWLLRGGRLKVSPRTSRVENLTAFLA